MGVNSSKQKIAKDFIKKPNENIDINKLFDNILEQVVNNYKILPGYTFKRYKNEKTLLDGNLLIHPGQNHCNDKEEHVDLEKIYIKLDDLMQSLIDSNDDEIIWKYLNLIGYCDDLDNYINRLQDIHKKRCINILKYKILHIRDPKCLLDYNKLNIIFM